MDLLANIDESELEGLLHDPDFLNIDPNLSAEERKKIIDDIRFGLSLEIFLRQIYVFLLLEKNVRKEKLSKFPRYLKRDCKKSSIHWIISTNIVSFSSLKCSFIQRIA